MPGQAPGFCRRLHLEQATAGPEEVEEAPCLGRLELCADRESIDSIAGQELGEEGLGAGALGP